MQRICVFCGSSPGGDSRYAELARGLGGILARRGLGLVYGGGNVGLMGVVAQRVLDGGGRVIGVIPYQLQAKELAHQGCTELVLVPGMHQRKQIMYDRADAFIVFPGGFGTLDEAMEILTWKQLGIHAKPVVFANIEGYFDGILGFVGRAIADGLLKPAYAPLAHFAADVPGLFAYLDDYTPRHGGVATWDVPSP